MAGRKPLNSAIFMKVRSQVILRADVADIEARTDVVRLCELVEQYRAEGSLNKFVMKALINQMLSDERGPQLIGVTGAQQSIDSIRAHANEVPALTHVQPVVQPIQEQARAVPEASEVREQTQQTPEMIIETTIKSLELANEASGETPQRTKRKLGGSALHAMGVVR